MGAEDHEYRLWQTVEKTDLSIAPVAGKPLVYLARTFVAELNDGRLVDLAAVFCLFRARA